MQRMMLAMSSRAEIMMTGMWRIGGSFRCPFEHGKPVKTGHHHVEQHKVDAGVRLGQAVEGFDSSRASITP